MWATSWKGGGPEAASLEIVERLNLVTKLRETGKAKANKRELKACPN